MSAKRNPSAEALRNRLIDKIEAHLRHRHAYKLATVEADYRYDVFEFDRITGAKSAKTSERAWKAARKNANAEGRYLDASGGRLTAAFAEYVAKVPGIDVEAERARVLATLHNLEGGYLNPCGGAVNPSPPTWIGRYVGALEEAIRDINASAAKAYDDPRRYAPQFENVRSDFFNISALAGAGERRITADAARLASSKNPSGDEEIDAERALDRIERARREAKKYTDKLQGFFERGEKIPQGFMKFHQAAIDKFKKASGVRGHYGKRKPSARANPEQLPRLALLGSAVEIRTSRSTLKPRGALLLVSEDGRQIVIARPTSRQAIAAPSGAARARGMFAKWAGRKSERALRLSVPTSALSFDLGDVLAIRYRSDKWGGRAQLYEHKFEGKATAIADAPRAPRLIRIDGKPARVLVTERGIVG